MADRNVKGGRGVVNKIAFLLIIILATIASVLSGYAAESSFSAILAQLEQTPSGLELLKKARTVWGLTRNEQILSRVQWADVSRTDAVLTRHFDPKTGEEERTREVVVYIKEDQSFENRVLDFSHELLHATSRPSWDPYDPTLTADRYIKAAIEGEGGEVQAVTMECKVAKEWAQSSGKDMPALTQSLERCQKFVGQGELKTAFYRVGKWKTWLRDHLSRQSKILAELTDEPVVLYSSTGGAPYPAALYREYQALTEVACENSKRRRESLRMPASMETAKVASLNQFLNTRCQ